jgi:hypothetical protein
MEQPAFMDRKLHLEILLELQLTFPHKSNLIGLYSSNNDKLRAIEYLSGHNLVDIDFPKTWYPHDSQPWYAKITAKGLDFIAADGGLSSILNVVTVQLHENTIRDLLISKIESALIPPEERSALKQAIRNLPGKVLEKLTDKMLDSGADYLVSETPRLGTLLAQLAGSLT